MSSVAYLFDKRLVRRAFGRAADTYNAAAVLQREVADRLLERLDLVKLDPHWIVDAGSGTGYCSRLLNRRYPKAQVVALDFAEAMLSQARRDRGWFAKQQFVCADIESLPLQAGRFDLICASLALQWCNDLDAALAGFARALRPGGLLVFTTFGPDTLKELRQSFAAVDGAAHVSHFLDMHDIGDALVRAGYEMPVMDVEPFTLTYPDLGALCRDLKAIGSRSAATGRAQGLMTPRRWQALCQAYEAFRQDSRLPATYEVVYGHAWAGQPASNRLLADGRVAVPFPKRVRR